MEFEEHRSFGNWTYRLMSWPRWHQFAVTAALNPRRHRGRLVSCASPAVPQGPSSFEAGEGRPAARSSNILAVGHCAFYAISWRLRCPAPIRRICGASVTPQLLVKMTAFFSHNSPPRTTPAASSTDDKAPRRTARRPIRRGARGRRSTSRRRCARGRRDSSTLPRMAPAATKLGWPEANCHARGPRRAESRNGPRARTFRRAVPGARPAPFAGGTCGKRPGGACRAAAAMPTRSSPPRST